MLPVNILFLLDDTAQIVHSDGEDPHYPYRRRDVPPKPSKNHIARQFIKDIVNSKVGQKARYFTLDYCGFTGSKPTVGQSQSADEMLRWINGNHYQIHKQPDGTVSFKPFYNVGGHRRQYPYDRNGGSLIYCVIGHTVESFYDAIYFMRKNMNEDPKQYRCAKNYIISIISSPMNQTKPGWNSSGVVYAAQSAKGQLTSPNARFASALDKVSPDGTNVEQLKKLWQNRQRWFRSQGRHGWDCGAADSEAYWALWGHSKGCRFYNQSDWSKYARFDGSRTFGHKVRSSSDAWLSGSEIWGGEDILGAPAAWIRDHDLVSDQSAKHPTDAAGRSWDQAPFAKQNIETFAMSWAHGYKDCYWIANLYSS